MFFAIAILIYVIFIVNKHYITNRLKLIANKKEILSYFDRYDSLLSEKMSFYRNLSLAGRQHFMQRVFFFRKSKGFLGREGLVVTDEMKILISATAVQITFGMKEYLLNFLEVIVVYPDIYISKLLKAELRGGMTTSGVMTLSWKYFEEGFKDSSDNLNLALHEFAHALELNSELGDISDDDFSSYLSIWHTKVASEFIKLRDGEEHYLRSYAGTNFKEFFAVCVENFFENPAVLKQELPSLYKQISILLNLDLLNCKQNDFLREKRVLFVNSIFNKDGKNVKSESGNYSSGFVNDWHWSFSLMLLGIIVCPMVIFYCSLSIFVPSGTLLFIGALIAVFAAKFQYSHFVKRLKVGLFFFSAYIFLGNVLLGLAFILFFNNNYIIGDPVAHRIKVSSYQYYPVSSSSGDNEYEIRFQFDDEYYTKLTLKTTTPWHNVTSNIDLYTETGVFGIPVASGYVNAY
ncbi:MAG: zinc-dependent peptidase [Bacteroidota bacterium]